ncbi:hypothetical protein DES53_112170 [Roseimicrobium gellanilyticum]|uniref:Uncharacterized protein n=1 Tax=Roseimicrobium gellanilyticum TaxID=748857 RepID=A0A366H7N1_9BACT|nr:hypothetical protein DES53_112170 [Roseimicrobium gellanilyticum]
MRSYDDNVTAGFFRSPDNHIPRLTNLHPQIPVQGLWKTSPTDFHEPLKCLLYTHRSFFSARRTVWHHWTRFQRVHQGQVASPVFGQFPGHVQGMTCSRSMVIADQKPHESQRDGCYQQGASTVFRWFGHQNGTRSFLYNPLGNAADQHSREARTPVAGHYDEVIILFSRQVAYRVRRIAHHDASVQL